MSGAEAAISQPFYSSGAGEQNLIIYLIRAVSQIDCGSFVGKARTALLIATGFLNTELEQISEGSHRFSTGKQIRFLLFYSTGDPVWANACPGVGAFAS
jgi:hypothetical protein